jgi:hypothetical protein
MAWAEKWISGDRSESARASAWSAVWSAEESAAWGAEAADVDIINILQRAYDWDPHKGGL